MRLTLRTLLAYLDDILEPEDREDIGAKVRDSEFATALVQRIRDVTRRERLGTPQIVGTGMGRDPNSVAEYLDNTLAAEQVQLFEKVCLESDVHLAEVASCHHIVTMILGEPAQVDAASRERMYRLIEESIQQPAQQSEEVEASSGAVATHPTDDLVLAPAMAAAAPVAAFDDDEPIPGVRSKPVVPEYLRDSPTRRMQTIILTVAGAALATAVVLALLFPTRIYQALGWKTPGENGPVAAGKNDASHSIEARPKSPLAPLSPTAPGGTGAVARDGTKSGVAAGGGGAVPGVTAAPPSGAADKRSSVSPTAPAVSGPAAAGLSALTVAPTVAPVVVPSGGIPAVAGAARGAALAGTNSQLAAAPTGAPPVAAAVVPPTGGTIPSVGGVPALGPGAGGLPRGAGLLPPGAGALPPGAGTLPTGTAALPPGTTAAGGPGATPAAGQVARADTLPAFPGGPATLPGGGLLGAAVPPGVGGAPAPSPPGGPVAVGRLLSEGQVLLRSTGKELPWERLAAQAWLSSGDRILVLPCFRPMIGLSGVSVEMDGPTQIDLGRADSTGAPQITIGFGRLIIRTLGQATARLRVHIGDTDGVLSFGDAESTLALEVRLQRIAGTDPEKVPSQCQATLFASSGRIKWTVGGQATPLQGPRRLTIVGMPVAREEKIAGLPGWITASENTPLEQRAAQRIEQAITPDNTVKLRLIEQASNQRVEVRNLATRSCAYIGHFEPLIKGLSDEEQRAGWMMYAVSLRDAVTRDAATAAAVRVMFEKLRQDKAHDLYRMLWGYSAADLAGTEARRLVQYLDHDDLDFRVLAFWNLQEITGLGLNYRPEYTEIKRKQSFIRWQKRLAEGKIVPANAPAASATPSSAPAARGPAR